MVNLANIFYMQLNLETFYLHFIFYIFTFFHTFSLNTFEIIKYQLLILVEIVFWNTTFLYLRMRFLTI